MSKAKTASAVAKPDAAPAAVVTSKDATAVVDAATALNAAASNVSLETVLAEAAQGFAPAADLQAAAPALPIPDGAAQAASDAAVQAQAEVDRLNATPPALEALFMPDFPVEARIFNSGTLGLSEPVSGAYLAGGGMAVVTLLDAEHAEAVTESLHDLITLNYLPVGTLSVSLASTPSQEVAP